MSGQDRRDGTGAAPSHRFGSDRALAIAAGGALGAGVRWSVLAAGGPAPGFPWPVLVVNLVGCGLLGMVLAEEWRHPRARLLLHDFGGIGFCGGLTTFSTFALELARFLDDGSWGLAGGYAAASLVGGIAAAVAGAAALRRVRALTLPLEEQW